jgi:hypothetical protein
MTETVRAQRHCRLGQSAAGLQDSESSGLSENDNCFLFLGGSGSGVGTLACLIVRKVKCFIALLQSTVKQLHVLWLAFHVSAESMCVCRKRGEQSEAKECKS